MELLPSSTLWEALKLPVEVVDVDGLPQVMSGNLPVTPLNVVLRVKRDRRGATDASLESSAHAFQLYVEFAARHGKSLINVTYEEFWLFTQVLRGGHFTDAAGGRRPSTGAGGPRPADKIIALLYSMAADVQELYGVRFDWYRYHRMPNGLVGLARYHRGRSRAGLFPHTHRVPYTPKKVLGLPDRVKGHGK